MTEAVIVAAARTPIGTARKGTLVDVSAFDLAKWAVGEALKRSGIPGGEVDDLHLGEVLQGGGDIARYAAIELGLLDVPGVAYNRHCASGMASVQSAAASIVAGMDRVVIAGGTESVSTSPMSTKRVPGTDEWAQWMSPSHPETPDAPAFDMSITVGHNTAVRVGITREEMDEWAYRSHVRAVAAIDEGRLAEETFPIEVTLRDGTVRKFDTDEHPRRDTTPEKLAALKPLHPEIDGFGITAGNASGLNDAAAAIVLTSADYAQAHGLRPLARILSWASAGVAPRDTGLGPVAAIPKALERAGLSVADVDLAEVNEAFASVPIAACRELGLDPEITNVNGSGCSLGHPVAATGARMIITTMFELRRRGGGIGLASMCAGGGMGSATVFEVVGG
ncbi:MAG: acetyl-CoA acetyltransferase [Acidimicrobiia bacterium]|nr:MAG: acetyl-CoA acetyltransferase [Acidimicrobiia bacterium]